MCSVAKFCKATTEVFLSFPVLTLVFLQALKSVVAGGKYKSSELGRGEEKMKWEFMVFNAPVTLWVVKHIFSQTTLPGTYCKVQD